LHIGTQVLKTKARREMGCASSSAAETQTPDAT
jgi:hypothetical protein